MKIVITDAATVFDQAVTVEPLLRFGEVTVRQRTAPEELAEAVADAEAVLCNKSPLTAEVLKGAKKLKYIGLFATGYNNIDTRYCRDHGITVCNAGSYSTRAVVQQTFALMLEHFNRVGDYDRFVKEGGWVNSPTFSPFVFPLNEIAGKTLGIVGVGSIGSAVAAVANAFGMRVLGYSRIPKPTDGVEFVSFDTLLRESDVVTVHCPLNADSAGMFGAEAFRKMKPAALFINTARGGVVQEAALAAALNGGIIGGAAVDVLAVEPMAADCPLRGAKNLIFTPHVAWAPVETRRRLIGIVAENIQAFLDGRPIRTVQDL